MSNPAELDAHVRQLIQDKNVREAAEACDQLNQRFPEYEKGWYTASYLAMLIDEPVIAVRAIDQALRLSPGKPEWLFQRLECLIATGDEKSARETARQLIKHDFSDAGLASRFASSLTSLGMYRGAGFHYARAIELEPRHPLAAATYNNLGTVHLDRGEIEQAIARWEQAVEALSWAALIEPEARAPRREQVAVHLARGEIGAAREAIEELERLGESEAELARMRSSVAEATRR